MTVALFIQYLTDDPVFYVSVVVAVVVSISLHELGHGVAAIWQGDDTPRMTGHMTLDPTVHMPPFSWLLLLLAGISYGLMPVDPTRFRSKFGDAIVAFAGPLVNLILSFIGLTAWAIWVAQEGRLDEGTAANFQQFFHIFGVLNLVLCAFNLLPVPPLDGSTVLANFSSGFRRIMRNPDNQPFFMGAFIFFFFFFRKIFAWGYGVAEAYLELWL